VLLGNSAEEPEGDVLEWAIIAGVTCHEERPDAFRFPAVNLVQGDEIIVRRLYGKRLAIENQLDAQ